MSDGQKAAELQTLKLPSRRGWYWQDSDDGTMHGPHETREAAAEDFWDDVGEQIYEEIKTDIAPDEMMSKQEWLARYEWISEAQTAPVTTDIFSAPHVLEDFDGRNEDAISAEDPCQYHKGEKGRELEMMLADALFRWCEKHGYWDEFRAMHPVSRYG